METFIPGLKDPYWSEVRKMYGVEDKENYIKQQREKHQNKRKFKLERP